MAAEPAITVQSAVRAVRAAIWFIQVQAAYLLSRRIGIDGVWMGYPAAFAAMLAGQAAYYGLFWRHRKYQRMI